MLHRGVIRPSEQEREPAAVVQHAKHLFRCQLQLSSQGLQNVCCTTLGGCCSVTMLDDADAGTGCQQACGRGDVESVLPVSTSAHYIHHEVGVGTGHLDCDRI